MKKNRTRKPGIQGAKNNMDQAASALVFSTRNPKKNKEEVKQTKSEIAQDQLFKKKEG